MSDKRETFARYLLRTMGLRKGPKVAAFVVAWGIYSDSLGSNGSPDMDGYTAYWGQSRATSYRELQLFREAFPSEAFPDRQWAEIRRAVKSREKLSTAVGEALGVTAGWSGG